MDRNYRLRRNPILHLLIYVVFGLLIIIGLVYLFSRLGHMEPNVVNMDEETLVRTYGDAALINLYYKAHTDADREEIVNFILNAQGMSKEDLVKGHKKASSKPEKPVKVKAPEPEEETFLPNPADYTMDEDQQDKEIMNELLDQTEVMGYTQFEAMFEEKKSRRQRKAEEKAAVKAQKDAEHAAKIAEANAILVRSSESGQVEKFDNLDAAIASAIAQASSPKDSPKEEAWENETVVMESVHSGSTLLDLAPTVETHPTVEKTPVAEAAPVVEEKPVAEAAPVVEEKPVAEAAPVVEEKPVAEAAPVVKEAPVAEETPVVEETPVIEITPPEPPFIPAVEETPVVEVAPVVEETPVVEVAPVVEETPVVEATPVVEETPVAEAAPVVEETPVAEAAPVVEEELPQRFCYYCGAPLEAGFRFCINCGMPLSGRAEEAPATEVAPVAEETPVVEEAPVAEEALVVEADPVVEADLVEEEAPVVEEKPIVELKETYSGKAAGEEHQYSIDKPGDMLADTIFNLHIPPILSLEEILDNVKEMDQQQEGEKEKRE